MPTVTRTFAFATTTDGYAANPAPPTGTVHTHNTTTGNPGGSLQTRTAGRNRAKTTSWWEWAGTWEDLGVPANSVVSSVRLTGAWTRVTEYNVGASSNVGPYELRDSTGATVIGTLWAGRSFTAVDAGTTVAAQPAITIPDHPSNTSIRIRLADQQATGNNNSAAVTSLDDQVAVEVTYTTPTTTPDPRALIMAYGFNEASGTQILDSSGNGRHGTLTANGTREPGRYLTGVYGNNTGQAATASFATVDPSNWEGFTVMAWVKRTNLDDYFTIYPSSSAGVEGIATFAFSGITTRPRAYINWNGGGINHETNETPNTQTGVWYHVAWVWDKAAATLQAFVNADGGTPFDVTGRTLKSFNYATFAGANVWNSTGNGYVDDVKVFNYPMAEADIVREMFESVGFTGSTKYPVAAHSSGRYYVDQDGNPILMSHDAAWDILSKLTPAQWDTHFAAMKWHGHNAFHALIGTGTRTLYDGTTQAWNGGDLAQPNTTYWAAVDALLARATEYDLTFIMSTLTYWDSFEPFRTNGTSKTYDFGLWLGNRYKNNPNVMWLLGGDWQLDQSYAGRDTDIALAQALVDGIRASGDTHMLAWHLWNNTPSSVADPAASSVEPDADMMWVYTYEATYQEMHQAWQYDSATRGHRPTHLAEAWYEGATSGTSFAMRKQAGWALTTGIAGHMYGANNVYNYAADWMQRLDLQGHKDIAAIQRAFQATSWWKLAPDITNTLITSGAGTNSSTFDPNDYATAAIATDKSLAWIYMPTSRAFTLDLSKVGANPVVTRVDPITLAETSLGTSGTYSAPGTNSTTTEGDWLIRITADPITSAVEGTATFTGSGTLTATGAPTAAGTAALTGAGSLTATGTPTATGSAALTGSGTLTAAGNPTAQATATLTGTGTLTATGSASEAGTATANLTGTGTLTATGTPTAARTVNLTGSGTLTATGAPAVPKTVMLSGAGTLTAVGNRADGDTFNGTATFTGTGTLTAAGVAQVTATAALSGAGVLSVVGTPGVGRTVHLTGTGDLTAAGTVQITRTIELTGTGTLTAVGINPGAYRDITVTIGAPTSRALTIGDPTGRALTIGTPRS